MVRSDHLEKILIGHGLEIRERGRGDNQCKTPDRALLVFKGGWTVVKGEGGRSGRRLRGNGAPDPVGFCTLLYSQWNGDTAAC